MGPASIVIPTRARRDYLEVALASIAPQAAREGVEVLVIDDGEPSSKTRALVEGFGARYELNPPPGGLNVARNTGVERSDGELVVFVDDDIRASPGWLHELIEAARANPHVDVLTGPIRPSLEGVRSRGCGREDSPITSLDLGPENTLARYAWGANMAIRRTALQRVGPFDVSLDYGDEQEWQDRLAIAPGNGATGTPSDDRVARVMYVARAAVDHRRAGADARLAALARAAYARGRGARRFDARFGKAPSLARELRTLLECLGHVIRRRCPAGLTMVACSAGRLQEGLRGSARGRTAAGVGDDDFLSGASGTVGGFGALRAGIEDELVDAWELASGRRLRLAIAARRRPPLRRVLVLGVERPERRTLAKAMRAGAVALPPRRRAVQLPGRRGRQVREPQPAARRPSPEDHDWLLTVDDDVELPHGFLDRLLFLCERFSLQLAQPAQRRDSHAAWPQTRRRASSVVRETSFVEIGPVTAFARATFPTLLPFPELRMGWGLDAHWAALAREHGWRCGVLDAVSIRHRAAPAGDAYSREAAVAEAREFLAGRPYLPAGEAHRTLTSHRRW